MTWILPRSYLSPLVDQGKLTVSEMCYGYCGWKFAYHFLQRTTEEFNILWDSLTDPVTRSRLKILRKRIRNEVATEARVAETIFKYPDLVQLLYKDFKATFGAGQNNDPEKVPGFNEELWKAIRASNIDQTDLEVLRAMLLFNASILKTNFFKNEKAALSFRLT